MAESPSEAAGPAGPLLPPTGLKGELWEWRGVPVTFTTLWLFAVRQQGRGSVRMAVTKVLILY